MNSEAMEKEKKRRMAVFKTFVVLGHVGKGAGVRELVETKQLRSLYGCPRCAGSKSKVFDGDEVGDGESMDDENEE